ncbi:MAG TPA: histidine phosphatase family protein [Ktedonobacteraceae bacterium]
MVKRFEHRTVLFVRHGQAQSDPERYEADERRPLTPAGRQAVAEISAQVALFAPRRLFCSPALRTYQSAYLLAEKTGLVPEQLAGLNERLFRSLLGLTREQIAQRCGPATMEALEQGSETIELPGEETLAQASQRVHSTLLHVLRGTQGRLALVSHGGPHGWLLATELGMSETRSRLFRLDEACFSLLEFVRVGSGFQLQQILALNTQVLPPGLHPRG